ncbi:MAG: hypothetical protein M3340_10195 [Actinomycetota bacterium]|nr:hypothetical protein [Actinomycetota bacterium]
MPPTQEMIDKAAEALGAVRLESFTANPTTIRPFEQAQLGWRVNIESGAGARPTLRLRGGGFNTNVPLAGSKGVSPTSSTTYSLVAVRPPGERVLGAATVTVDPAGCITLSTPESEIREQVVSRVDEFLAQNPEIKRRRDDSVEIEADGIRIAIRLEAEVEDWSNPDVNIDARITLRAADGAPHYELAGFDTELDFPWFADVVHHTLLPAAIALAMSAEDTKGLVRGFIVKAVEAMLDEIQRALDEAGQRLLTLATAPNEVSYTVCPAPATGGGPIDRKLDDQVIRGRDDVM